jgi:hypothetical protein
MKIIVAARWQAATPDAIAITPPAYTGTIGPPRPWLHNTSHATTAAAVTADAASGARPRRRDGAALLQLRGPGMDDGS